jgi:hypothetical protein
LTAFIKLFGLLTGTKVDSPTRHEQRQQPIDKFVLLAGSELAIE